MHESFTRSKFKNRYQVDTVIVDGTLVAYGFHGRGTETLIIKESVAHQITDLGILVPDKVFNSLMPYLRMVNNGAGIVGAERILSKELPQLSLLPPHLHQIIQPNNINISFAEAIVAMLWKFDLSGMGALYFKGNDAPRAKKVNDNADRFQEFENQLARLIDPESFMRLGGKWYAFKNLDDAIMAKMISNEPTCRVFPLVE